MKHFIISEPRRLGDFRLEDIRDKFLGTLSGDDDHASLIVRRHVHIRAAIGEARIRNLKRLPAARLQRAFELTHLRIVELDRISRQFLRRIVVAEILGHSPCDEMQGKGAKDFFREELYPGVETDRPRRERGHSVRRLTQAGEARRIL